MSRMEKTTLALFSFLLLTEPTAVQAQFGYTTNTDGITCTITNYTGSGGAVTVPSNINNLTVTVIGNGTPASPDDVFADTTLTSITIPNSVISIGDSAFFGCTRLTSVSVGNGVTNIDDFAFADCTRLTGIYFQGNAPSADATAFLLDNTPTVYYLLGTTGWGSTFGGLPTVAGQTNFIDGYFYSINASNANTITITGYIGPGGAVAIPTNINGLLVTVIGNHAFDAFGGNTSPISLTIPGSVTSIGSYAFNGCASLIDVMIGNGVTDIGTQAFENCTSLTSAYFQGNAPSADPSVFADDPVTVYYLPSTTGWSSTCGGAPAVLSIDQEPFTYITNADNSLTITGYTGVGGAVTIPTNINGLPVACVGDEAFMRSLNLITSIRMPDGIASIGDFAFAGNDLTPELLT